MRSHVSFGAAVCLVAIAACSGELAERPAAQDPTSVAAAEAPFTPPPAYQPDPLMSPLQPAGREPPGVHKPAQTEPPGQDDHEAMPGMDHGPHGAMEPRTLYTCPMHPDVRVTQPGKCPKCGMTLVPVEQSK